MLFFSHPRPGLTRAGEENGGLAAGENRPAEALERMGRSGRYRALLRRQASLGGATAVSVARLASGAGRARLRQTLLQSAARGGQQNAGNRAQVQADLRPESAVLFVLPHRVFVLRAHLRQTAERRPESVLELYVHNEGNGEERKFGGKWSLFSFTLNFFH